MFEPIALKNVNDDTYQFDMVNYQQADRGVGEFLKYLANFVFYRFGLEVKEEFYLIEIEVFFVLDLFYNNSDCYWNSHGYSGGILCSLAWNIFNI